MRLFANANYDFIGHRHKAYIGSAIAVAICFAFALVFQITRGSWLNYGVDFTGGSFVQVKINAAATEADVRQTVETRVPGSTVSSFGEGGEFAIRTPGAQSDVATGPSESILAALREQYGADKVELVRSESVGAKVGSELQTRALIAVLISFAATLIYLAFRFEWRFGVAAVAATAHDVLLSIGLIAALRMEVALPMVAAVLTILGYSLNDKIVVFDRIRENMRSPRRPEFVTLLNKSINETLPRTVLTGMSTLATLVSLWVFGGTIVREFSAIMVIGILLGTYSSIFIGSPVLYAIEKRFPHEQPTVKRQRTARPTRGPSRV